MKKEESIGDSFLKLHREIHAAEKNKQEILAKIHALKEACLNREMTFKEYEEQLNQKLGELTLPQWVEYYDNYQEMCLKQLENRR